MYFDTPVSWPHMNFLLLHMQGWILRRAEKFMRQRHPGVGKAQGAYNVQGIAIVVPRIFEGMAIEQIS